MELPKEVMYGLKNSVDRSTFSQNYVELTGDEMRDVVEFLQSQQQNQYLFQSWAIVGQGEAMQFQEIPSNDDGRIWQAPSTEGEVGPLTFWEEDLQNQASAPYDGKVYNGIVCFQGEEILLTESWVWVNHEICHGSSKEEDWTQLGASWIFVPSEGAQLTNAEPEKAMQVVNVKKGQGFFDNWPSFGVESKMHMVVDASASAFVFGFMLGSKTTFETLLSVLRKQCSEISAGAAIAAALAVTMAPKLILTGMGCIIIGGVIGGVTVATPVFVVGTGGVFVSATVYHSFILAKRGAQKGLGS